MTIAPTETAPGRLAKFLALASVAGFWLLPFSPRIAIGAVSMTRKTSGWSRRLALTGATLCIGYTMLMAVVVVGLFFQIR